MPGAAPITRRKFLKLGCAAIGGMVLACGGLTLVATREPEIAMPQSFFGENSTVNNKILVAYATKSGATVDVAQTIGKALADKGAAVDVAPIKSVKSLEGYRAVVVGSAIRMGRWLPEAVEFVRQNQARLAQVRTAFFTVHLLHLDDGEESRNLRAAYTEPVRKIAMPVTEAFFAGRMAYANLSLIERFISSAMRAPEQDLRDWSKIRAWAESVYPTLA